MGKLDSFYIAFTGNEQSIFFPGQTINGSAIINLNSSMKMRGMYIWCELVLIVKDRLGESDCMLMSRMDYLLHITSTFITVQSCIGCAIFAL